ncbi:MAG: aminopeptidase P family protein [Clostridia bacterium]|nr:MAG: aminopeptidase P family protein [Clostridia bacterium]
MNMELPNLELVPVTELYRRVQLFQEKLQEFSVDGALITQDVDLYYFSGTSQRAQLFIPAAGEPVLMVQKSLKRARMESTLDQIVPVPSRKQIPDVLADFGHRPQVLGLELDVLPAESFILYQRLFPSSRMDDVSHLIKEIRAVKSDYEIGLMERSADIVYRMFAEAPGVIQEGMTEIEVSGLLETLCRRHGHYGIVRVRGYNQFIVPCHTLFGASGGVPSAMEVVTGGESMTPATGIGGGRRRLVADEPIYVDCAAGVNGYLADITRTLCRGRLPDRFRRAFALAVEMEENLVPLLKPGVTGLEVYQAAKNMVDRTDLADNFMGIAPDQMRFIGHGVGLELNEFPPLAQGAGDQLRAGMVIAIEPTFAFADGVIGIEDNFVITHDGCRPLRQASRELIEF